MVCKLCGEDASLRHSHVFPEFFYSGTYDDTHSFVSVSSHPRHRPRRMQKGLREHLLCGRCEGQFSRYETYVARLLNQADALFQEGASSVELQQVDFHSLRLFALSILWRAHISKHHVFGAVRLGPHEKLIHSRLVSEQLGPPHEYGFAIAKVTGLDTHGEMIITPMRMRYRSATAYLVMARGYHWVFFVTAHSASLAPHVPFVGSTKTLNIPAVHEDQDEMFQWIRRAFPGSR